MVSKAPGRDEEVALLASYAAADEARAAQAPEPA